MPGGEAERHWPDLSRPRRVHVVGAGGSGMSAISTVLMAMGHHVTGTDAVASPTLSRLEDQGATVEVGHRAESVGPSVEIFVRSTAVPDDNPEVVEARRRGLRVWKRSEVLAAICSLRRVAAVSGTHGKTTTSTLLYLILAHAGLEPSMIIGGDIAGLGPGAAWGGGDWLVVEADESDGTFLELGAEAVIVTSVEPDHLEHYGGEEALREAFVEFVAGATGPSVLCADDPGARALTPAGRHVVTYGTEGPADVAISELRLEKTETSFVVVHQGRTVASVSLPAPGVYNARNATAAMTLAQALGVSWQDAADAVAGYRGVARRFERRGERGGVTYVDDYGHLPGEVAAVLAAARAGGWARVVAAFQPHRYSRTESLWSSFSDAFVDADVVVLTDVYAAGEARREGVSGHLIYDAVRGAHPEADVRYAPDLTAVEAELKAVLRPGDLCLTLGAGDITRLPDRMLQDGAAR